MAKRPRLRCDVAVAAFDRLMRALDRPRVHSAYLYDQHTQIVLGVISCERWQHPATRALFLEGEIRQDGVLQASKEDQMAKMSKSQLHRAKVQSERLKGEPGVKNPHALARHQVQTGQKAGYPKKAAGS